MPDQDKRRSDRVIPSVSDEEIIVIHQEPHRNRLAKMMELSEVGTLAYLLEDAEVDGSVELSIYHQGRTCRVPATVSRATGRLISFQFANPSVESAREIQSKLIFMEVEWMRLSRRR